MGHGTLVKPDIRLKLWAVIARRRGRQPASHLSRGGWWDRQSGRRHPVERNRSFAPNGFAGRDLGGQRARIWTRRIDELIAAAQAKFPGLRFSLLKPADGFGIMGSGSARARAHHKGHRLRFARRRSN